MVPNWFLLQQVRSRRPAYRWVEPSRDPHRQTCHDYWEWVPQPTCCKRMKWHKWCEYRHCRWAEGAPWHQAFIFHFELRKQDGSKEKSLSEDEGPASPQTGSVVGTVFFILAPIVAIVATVAGPSRGTTACTFRNGSGEVSLRVAAAEGAPGAIPIFGPP